MIFRRHFRNVGFVLVISMVLLPGSACFEEEHQFEDHDPCKGKSCGDTCTLCDPEDPDCVETAVEKYCDMEGACNVAFPDCSGEND